MPGKEAGMLRLLPRRWRAYLNEKLRQLIRANMPNLDRREGFYPYRPHASCYLIPKTPPASLSLPGSRFAIPPRDLWVDYGSSPAEYLDSGKLHVDAMRRIASEAGAPIEQAGRVLEWGCAAGRMIRWLDDVAFREEVWGTDIHSTHIVWASQHLSPPFHFATTSLHPHLPFADGYFGFIYAGSIFTHVDDLHATWMQELRRVLKPGGLLYVTIHDRHTLDILRQQPTHWLSKQLNAFPEFSSFAESDFGFFTIGRSVWSQVFIDVDFLRERQAPFFEILSVTKEAYAYQTAVLFRRK